VLVALALLTAGRAFLAIAQTEIVMHVPVMAIEAIVTGSAIAFLRKVRPEVLAALGPAAEHTVA
jgi:cobalt/nickel transport system permease protein